MINACPDCETPLKCNFVDAGPAIKVLDNQEEKEVQPMQCTECGQQCFITLGD